uniref:Ig-like domain-containing protein n=1 Tax=Vespula pensylvanica TaxID=30213 RepID=A0A834NC99_VESPE|nr:hypothetical protein H0235_015519 [Vespula pensylvanica]
MVRRATVGTVATVVTVTGTALPERGPEITGLSEHYAVGENVTANCTAWPSIPKADLRWTINGETVAPVLVVVIVFQQTPTSPIYLRNFHCSSSSGSSVVVVVVVVIVVVGEMSVVYHTTGSTTKMRIHKVPDSSRQTVHFYGFPIRNSRAEHKD